MRALTVRPGQEGSLAVEDVPDPWPGPGDLLVDGLAVGICGTDREIADGQFGTPPPGRERLVLGHESLGRVREAPAGSGFAAGELVVGMVRHPDPVPCGACAQGAVDMCRNGRYTERGIEQLDGFAGQTWTLAPDHAVRVPPALGDAGVLVEPASVLAKAWEQIERIGGRSWFEPERVLVTGAGPIGLLAALLGCQRGLDVHVLDRVRDGRKPALVEELGATYHCDGVEEALAGGRPDVVVEATGVPSLVLAAMAGTAPYGIVCLTGVSTAAQPVPLDAGELNRSMVMGNRVVVGSVNAGLRHYGLAVDALAAADPGWLGRLVSRRVPLDSFAEAFQARDDDVKVVLELA